MSPLLPALLSFTALCALGVGCATPKPGTSQDESFGAPDRGHPFSVSSTHPEVPPQEPVRWDAIVEREATSRSAGSNIIEFAFGIYSDHITKIDGARCEHRPTCSRYCLEAVRKHGFVVGSWLTLDRLMRGPKSSSLRVLPLYKFEKGKPYFRDPVEANDFFF